MMRQNTIAHQQDFTFLRTTTEVRRFVESGLLVPLRGNEHYKVAGVSFPYARKAVQIFVERVAAQYHAACGEQLVVTSLTRPMSRQPRNAHELSVHPTGMAADFRISRKSSCRNWLESTLRDLERARTLDATRERRPAHYHVAIFPEAYTRHVASVTGATPAKVAASTSSPGMNIATVKGGPEYASILPMKVTPAQTSSTDTYTVKTGDSLWTIARRYETTVTALKQANSLARSTIQPGQKLTIPGAAVANDAQSQQN